MEKRQKPNFSDSAGTLVNPEFIPLSVRNELLQHLLESPLTNEEKSSLIAFSGVIGQSITSEGESDASQKQREQIESIEINARRLLASPSLLGRSAKQTMQSNTGYLIYGSEPPAELEEHVKTAIKTQHGDLLGMSWDWITALEKAAAYTAGKYKIDRQSKPQQMRARDFVAMQADHIRKMTGQLPPKDRSGWFASFAERLGEHVDLPVGSRIVASGIEAAR